MTFVPIPINAQAPIQLNQNVRNGLGPVAELQNLIAERAGYWIRNRTKLLWQSPCSLAAVPTSDSLPRTRWRFAFHTGPYGRYVFAHVYMAYQNSGAAADCYAILRIRNRAGTIVSDTIRRFGSNGLATSDIPSNFSLGFVGLTDSAGALLELDSDTDYFGEWIEVNGARLVSAGVHEVADWPDTDNGYAAMGAAGGSPIYDIDRVTPRGMANAQWLRGAVPLWSWSADDDSTAPTVIGGGSPSTYINVIDNSSTTVTTATPGVKLDMRYRSTLRRAASGVPVRLWVYAGRIEGSSVGIGSARIVNAAGATVIDVPLTSTVGWYMTEGYLPATDVKYDLHFGGNQTDDIAIYAMTLYEYDDGAVDQGFLYSTLGAMTVAGTGTVV